MEAIEAFAADLQAGPQWVEIWVNYMGAVMMLAIPFAFRRVEARWTVLVMILTFPAMIALHNAIGYVRLLGIVHVVFWTPLVIYLWGRREHWCVKETLSGKWILVLLVTMIISLAFDYSDVVRWLLGDKT